MCQSPGVAGAIDMKALTGFLGWQKIGRGGVCEMCEPLPALPGAMDMKALTGFLGGSSPGGLGFLLVHHVQVDFDVVIAGTNANGDF